MRHVVDSGLIECTVTLQGDRHRERAETIVTTSPVSYTHLTLPTNREV